MDLNCISRNNKINFGVFLWNSFKYGRIINRFCFAVANPVVYRGFLGCGGTREQWGGGTFWHWRNQKFRVFSNSKIFKKCLKNQWKNYNYLKILKEILRFFEIFLKSLSKFSRKFNGKCRKFWKCAFVGGSG